MASSTTTLRQQVLHKHKRVGKNKATPSAGKMAAYASAFLLLIAVVAIGYQSPQHTNSQVAGVGDETKSTTASDHHDIDVAPPVDEVIATDVAADLASRANLPVATNIANASISLTAKSELAQTDTSAITKPQLIQASSRTDVTTYTTVQGDTVPSVATKFSVTADTVRWANDLPNTDIIEPGRTLTILPISGLLHTVTPGDTLESIASKYTANADRITSVNNLELSGVTNGQRLVIPDGIKPSPVPAATNRNQSLPGSTNGSRVSTNVFATAGNRYADGNCTWYVYERRAQIGKSIGSYWGNANTWDTSAAAAGFTVGRIPRPGAIIQWDEYSEPYISYAGHVGVVERVLENGDIVITEMNNSAYGGFNIVNQRTISASQAAERKYIY